MPKKILIVEDSPEVSGALKMLLELEGYEAAVAGTGSIGRDMARTERPDLILMDIGLPDISGIELTRELRSRRETSETPIVCVSAYGHGLLSEAVGAGCNEAISKGKFIDSFRPTLKKYLGE